MSVKLMDGAWGQRLPLPQKMVLLALADFASDSGDGCFPSVAYLAEKCSLAERTVQGCLSALEAEGFLSRAFRSGRSTNYKLNPRRICTPAGHAPPHDMHPTPAGHAPLPPQEVHPTPAGGAPITVSEPSSEPLEEPNPIPASQSAMRGVARKAAGFDAFWATWPKKVGKQEALRVWCRMSPDLLVRQAILAAVERVLEVPERWHKDGRDWQLLPDPARWLRGCRWEDEAAVAVGYTPEALGVFSAYSAALATCGWPAACAEPFSAERSAAIREFLTFGRRDGWVAAYFAWLADKLPAKEGYGFDWAISRATYLRAKEGNFAALRDAA